MNEQLESRGSLLDAFARAPEVPLAESSNALMTVGAAPPVERVIGAQQIAIPRDEKKILEKIKVLAAAAGTDWYYRYPVKSKGGGQDWVEGPSIKLANDLARLYGNCEIETRVTDLGDSWLIYARFTDYETGFVMTRPFQQRKGQRGMRTGDDRGLDIAFQIGASKAIRNVIVNSLQTFADFAFDEARNSLIEKIGRNLEGWRERCIQRIAERKIELNRVERAIGRPAKDWMAPDLARVVAMLQSIIDGMSSADDAFPPLEKPSDSAGSAATSTPSQAEPDDQGAAGEVQSAHDAGGSPGDPSVVAYKQGQEAKAAGHLRKSLPGEYHTAERAREAECWLAGYDGKQFPIVWP